MAVRGGKREQRGERQKELPALMSELEVNPMFEDLLDAIERPYMKFLLMGGMRSGKTRQLMIWMVFACLKPESFLPERWRAELDREGVTGPTILIAREVFKDIKKTLWEDACWVCRRLNIFPKDGKENGYLKVNRSDFTLFFKETGASIWFVGAQDDTSGMGVSPHICWLNEISEISKDFYRQVDGRTKLATFFDCNPKMFANHWARQELLTNEGLNPEEDSSAVWVHRSTWRDNKFLPKKIRVQIASWEPTEKNIRNGTADEYWWKVYGLGVFAVMEGLVFPEGRSWDWCETSEFPSPETAASVYCLDFGFRDPLAFGRVAIRDNEEFIDELIYERELLISAPETDPGADCLTKRLTRLGVPKHAVIAADEAATEQIAALHAAGWTGVIGVKKGPGSIRFGLSLMKQRFLKVTRRSSHWAVEAQEYCYPKGAQARSPDEVNPRGRAGDHIIDMSRYGTMYLLRADGNVKSGFGRHGRPVLKSVSGVKYDY